MTEKFSCPEPSEAARRAYIAALNVEPGTFSSVLAAAYAVDVPQIVKAEVERALASFSEPGVQSVVTDLAAKYVRERFGEEPGTPEEQCAEIEAGLICTLRSGHPGDHEAWGIDECLRKWPRRSTAPATEQQEPIRPTLSALHDLGMVKFAYSDKARLDKLERFCTALARIYEVANPGDSRVTNVRAAAREYLRP